MSLKQPIFSVTGCCLSCECYQQQQQQQPATSLVTTVGYAASLYDDWLWRCAGVDVVNDGVNYSVTESATTRARASCRRAHSAIWCRVSRRHASPGIGPTVYTRHLFFLGGGSESPKTYNAAKLCALDLFQPGNRITIIPRKLS